MEDSQTASSGYCSMANEENVEVKSPRPLPRQKTTQAHEMRAITENFNNLLKKATTEIKRLTTENAAMRNQFEEQLKMNEDLAKDLSRLLESEKRIKEERQGIMKANQELYEEAQRLSDEEAKWKEEREDLEGQIERLTKGEEDELARLKNEEELARLRVENERLLKAIEVDKEAYLKWSEHLERENEELKAENKQLLERKERAAAENLQLVFDCEEQDKKFKEINARLEERLAAANEKVRKLEGLLNETAKAPVPKTKKSKEVEALEDKVADLVMKNKNLHDWRNQVIDKNKLLAEENEKLRELCSNLEGLLNEESSEIKEALDFINNVHGSPETSPPNKSILKMSHRDTNYL